MTKEESRAILENLTVGIQRDGDKTLAVYSGKLMESSVEGILQALEFKDEDSVIFAYQKTGWDPLLAARNNLDQLQDTYIHYYKSQPYFADAAGTSKVFAYIAALITFFSFAVYLVVRRYL